MKFHVTSSFLFLVQLIGKTSIVFGDEDTVELPVNIMHQSFADSLTKEIYNNNENNNDFTSTFGISLALSILYPAAIDISYEQIHNVIKLPQDNTRLVWKAITDKLESTYNGDCTTEINIDTGECFGNSYGPELIIASHIFVDNNQTLDPKYETIVNTDANQQVESIDFDASTAGSIINDWVNITTRGKINTIVDDGPQGDLDAAILTALYLKAGWKDTFNNDFTTLGTFYTDVSTMTSMNDNTQFMHDVRYDQYYSDTVLPGYQILQLPLGNWNSALSMILVLPLSTSTSMVSSMDLLNAINMTSTEDGFSNSNLERRRVAISIPKFTVEAKYEDTLENAIKIMGMTEPMDPNCNTLCIFENTCSAYISKLVHKTFLDVNEVGIEAAAVTMAGISLTSMPLPETPILFQANYPFQLFIYDASEQLVLFEGRISNPQVAEGTSAPTLVDVNHEEVSFWEEQFRIDSMLIAPITTIGMYPFLLMVQFFCSVYSFLLSN